MDVPGDGPVEARATWEVRGGNIRADRSYWAAAVKSSPPNLP